MTDEAFLEAVLSFMTSIPTADIYQEKAWQQARGWAAGGCKLGCAGRAGGRSSGGLHTGFHRLQQWPAVERCSPPTHAVH